MAVPAPKINHKVRLWQRLEAQLFQKAVVPLFCFRDGPLHFDQLGVHHIQVDLRLTHGRADVP